MEVKQEIIEFSEETLIKPEPGSMDPKTAVKVEQYEGNSENPQISPTQPFTTSTIKIEPQDGGSFSPHIDNIREVKASDFLVNLSDLVNIKQEIVELDVNKTESLTTVCDLPSLKTDILEYFDEPCSSSQTQQLLLSQSNKRGAVKKVVKKNRRKYPCPVCNKSFVTISARKKHIDQHFKNYIICPKCGQIFKLKISFLTHYIRHWVKLNKPKQNRTLTEQTEIVVIENEISQTKKKGSHKCEICFKSFSRKNLLNTHLKAHAGAFKCIFCSNTFSSSYTLANHMHTHSDKSLNRCDICFKTFTSSRNLKFHASIHSETPHQCEICFKIFTTIYSLKYHKQKHANENIIECENCLKKFNCQQGYNLHIVACHAVGKPFQCGICSRKFATNSNLKNHLSTHSEFPPQCQICLKIFTTNESLENHVKLHTGENLLECQICFKKFNIKQSLNRHLKRHETVKQFHCEICSKRYNSKANLKNHMRIHPGFQPFQCEVCSNKFEDQQSLSTHLMTTHSQNLLQCTICFKSFTTRKSLTRHLKTHQHTLNPSTKISKRKTAQTENESIFKCQICSISFTRRSMLSKHIWSIHSECTNENLTCRVCSVKFKNVEIWSKHNIENSLAENSFCDLCSEPMTLKCHKSVHSVRRCIICLAPYSSQWALDIHYRKKHGLDVNNESIFSQPLQNNP